MSEADRGSESREKAERPSEALKVKVAAADHEVLMVAILKRDLFGQVEKIRFADGSSGVRRNARLARWWLRLFALWLARREAQLLQKLAPLDGVPKFLGGLPAVVLRSWLEGVPLQEAQAVQPQYFRQARRLLVRMHRLGVVHNDTAKEPNWLVQRDGSPALVDFQLGWAPRRRSALFRLAAREDLRHLLKHKRTYCPTALTARDRRILQTPSVLARGWRILVKPIYLAITRGLLGWRDREGAGDRNSE